MLAGEDFRLLQMFPFIPLVVVFGLAILSSGGQLAFPSWRVRPTGKEEMGLTWRI
jgi:hypothetical protein